MKPVNFVNILILLGVGPQFDQIVVVLIQNGSAYVELPPTPSFHRYPSTHGIPSVKRDR